MLRRFAIALSLGLVASSFSQLPDVHRDFVLTDKDAVGMLSPRVVSGGYTGFLSFSSDGSLLLAFRVDVAPLEAAAVQALSGQPEANALPRGEILFYSVKGNRIKSTIPVNDVGMKLVRLEWIPKSSQAVITYTRIREATETTRAAMETVNAMLFSDGRVRNLGVGSENENVSVIVSPTSPEVGILRTSYVRPPAGSGRQIEVQGTVTFVPAVGSPGNPHPLPTNFSEFHWGTDGQPYVSCRIWSADHKTIKFEWQRMDRATGRLGQAVSKRPESAERGGLKAIGGLMAGPMTFKPPVPKEMQADFPSLSAVILAAEEHTKNGFAVVSSDGAEGLLSPSGDSVAYVHHGIALLRPLVHIPKDAFLEALAAAKRQELMQNAKQVALAFTMFAMDNDNKLPGKEDNWQNTLDPYMRNRSIADGFVFTLTGADLGSVDNPASTQLGYIDGPGGKAVAYADGHVKWIPNGK